MTVRCIISEELGQFKYSLSVAICHHIKSLYVVGPMKSFLFLQNSFLHSVLIGTL